MSFRVTRASLSLFRLQMYPPSQAFTRISREGALLPTAVPRNVLSRNLATKFNEIGVDAELTDIHAVAQAACLKYLPRPRLPKGFGRTRRSPRLFAGSASSHSSLTCATSACGAP
eukprot:6593315-Pyramimonas_sp.AAC.1